jgi:hypothetical protein
MTDIIVFKNMTKLLSARLLKYFWYVHACAPMSFTFSATSIKHSFTLLLIYVHGKNFDKPDSVKGYKV